MSADRNLLFGILAVQSGFCTGPQLVEAMNAWTLAKDRPLGDILVERGYLQRDEHDLLTALVAKQLSKHGGDVDKSLASLTPIPRLRAELRQIQDSDLQLSLAALPSSRPEDPDHTRTHETSSTGEAVRYRILRPHARGGLGEVYVARDEELGREVALKEIQSTHAHDPNSRDRFVREAEVTGGLEHPGIVAVYGLGSYADGRPFYAMRFIQGDSLKEAIERFHKAGKPNFAGSEFRQLLGRFIDVCQAIAYAHSRGVLHRDLKPGNIMLGKFGETLVVDWGLAKVVGTKEVEYGDRTLNISSGSGSTPTMQGQAIGTPAFMSPEQATGRLDELGPATDVYSLGATLYALLANRAPIDADGIAEALRKAERGEWTPLREMNAAIPAPLAAICAKAMATKPVERYGSAQELAFEVERFLADEPVTAHRDPLMVRIGRWSRKHRTAVATTVATLIVGAAAMGIGLAFVGDRNSKLAESNHKLDVARQDAETAKAHAVKRLTHVENINDLLTTVFEEIDVENVKQSDAPLEAVLAKQLIKAAEQLDGAAIGDPLVVAKLQNRLGVSLLGLGFAAHGKTLCEKAHETQKVHLGRDHPLTLASLNNLAAAIQAVGPLDRAIPLFEEALKSQRRRLGPDHPDTLTTMGNLANSLQEVARFDSAMPLLEETLLLKKAKLGPDHPETLAAMNGLAVGLKRLGRFERAISLYEEALKLQNEKLGPDHPHTLITMTNLGEGLREAGLIDRAVQLLEDAFKLQKVRLGPDHPNTLTTMNGLAVALQANGQGDRSLRLFEEAHRLVTAKHGPDHPRSLESMNNYAAALTDDGKINRALPLLEEALKRQQSLLGFDHPDTLLTMTNLAAGLRANGKFDRAIALYEEALKLKKAKFGPEHPSTLRTMSGLANGFRAAGRIDRALPVYEEALNLFKTRLGPGHPDTLTAMGDLAAGLLAARQVERSIPLFEEALRLLKAGLGPDHRSTLKALNDLAVGLQLAGQLDRALAIYEEALKLRKERLGPDHPETLTTMANFAAGLQAARKFDRALPIYEEALRHQKAKLGPDHANTLHTMASFAEALQAAGQLDRAIPLGEAAAAGVERRKFQHEHARGIVRVAIWGYEDSKQFANAERWRRKWLTVVKQNSPANSQALADELAGLGWNLLAQGKGDVAQPILIECLSLRERTGPDHWTTFDAKSMLGGALLFQKKFADCEPLLISGYLGLKAREKMMSPDDRKWLDEAIDRLIELYTATKNPDQVKKWQAERAKYPAPEPPTPKAKQ
jgi:serine/threonine protein kinase/tetratricopeptide (TPR) repeat protein